MRITSHAVRAVCRSDLLLRTCALAFALSVGVCAAQPSPGPSGAAGSAIDVPLTCEYAQPNFDTGDADSVAAQIPVNASAQAGQKSKPVPQPGFIQVISLLEQGCQFTEPSKTPPKGNYKLPAPESPKAVYATVRLGDEERLIMADYAKSGGRYYNRIIFDVNGNRDLTDDKPVNAKTDSLAFMYLTSLSDPIDTTVSLHGRPMRYRFRCVMDNLGFGRRTRQKASQDKDLPELALASECFYRGTLKTSKDTYQLALYDSNCDGDFEDVYDPDNQTSSCDMLAVYKDAQAGKVLPLSLCNLLVVGPDTFRVAVNGTRNVVRLEPFRSESVLQLTMPPTSMQLYSRSKDSVMMYEPAAEVHVPAQVYDCGGYTALRKDEQGDLWCLTALAKGFPPVAVQPTSTTRMRLGEPYRAHVTMSRAAGGGGLLGILFGAPKNSRLLSFALQGQGGESVQSVIRVRGQATRIPMARDRSGKPERPSYRIIKNDGEIVAEGNFEYG